MKLILFKVFKSTLSTPTGNAKAPSLTTTREQVIDAASKLWYNYVDAERKSAYRVPWELHNQIQSKIQKVTGGLTRLASRSKVKKEEHVKTKSLITRSQAYESTNVNVGLVRDLCDQRYIQHINMTQHTLRYVCQDWLQSERELIRERGLWGPVKVSQFQFAFRFHHINSPHYDRRTRWTNGCWITPKVRIECERSRCETINSICSTFIGQNLSCQTM